MTTDLLSRSGDANIFGNIYAPTEDRLPRRAKGLISILDLEV